MRKVKYAGEDYETREAENMRLLSDLFYDPDFQETVSLIYALAGRVSSGGNVRKGIDLLLRYIPEVR